MVSMAASGNGFRATLLWRLAVIAPVIAAVLAEPGLLVEQAATVTEEGLDLLPGESMSSRVKREYTNNRAARRRVFKQTDLNGDGLVTRKEYIMENGNMTEEELDILFGAFDVDGDRSLSQDEFVKHGFIWMVVDDCEMEAIQRCDDAFVRLIRGEDAAQEDDQQTMLCRAFQTYFDCIEHEQNTCDIAAYSHAVVDLVATYRTINFCPDLDFDGLFPLPDADAVEDDHGDEAMVDDDVVIDVENDEDLPSELLSSDQDEQEVANNDETMVGYRTKRAEHTASNRHGFRSPWSGFGFVFDSPSLATSSDNPKANGDTKCTSSSLYACTRSFNYELRRNPYADLCDSLSDYRHCVTRHARRCPEFELVEVEGSLRKWLHFHQRLELC